MGGFNILVFHLDSNYLDAFPLGSDPDHNICQYRDWSAKECYGVTLQNCRKTLTDLWWSGLKMMEDVLKTKTATWHIVNTHFPGPAIASKGKIQELHKTYGIDLLFTGHTHWQSVGKSKGINWIISGGGGGVSADSKPNLKATDHAYGFVDFTISKTTLKVDMHSWGGVDNHAGEPIITTSRTYTAHGLSNSTA